MPIKISVVIPTYQRPQLLRKCLHRLANQSLNKQFYEAIVVSDGPDDISEQVVTEASFPNLSFLSLPNKNGPAAARNHGWKNAHGTLIAFTDDDCLPDLNWLESILGCYNSEALIAYTGKVIVPVSGKPTDFELNTKGLETGEFVTANCALTKTALQTIQGFDDTFTAAWREDSDLHFKLIQSGISIKKLDEAVVIHPVRKAPWGVSIREQKKSMYNALLYKKYPALYRQRIKAGPNRNYYCIVLSFLAFTCSILSKLNLPAAVAFGCWLLLTIAFILKRLSNTRRTVSHIFEMIATSVAIPFLSVYWTIYGAIKYRVLFF